MEKYHSATRFWQNSRFSINKSVEQQQHFLFSSLFSSGTPNGSSSQLLPGFVTTTRRQTACWTIEKRPVTSAFYRELAGWTSEISAFKSEWSSSGQTALDKCKAKLRNRGITNICIKAETVGPESCFYASQSEGKTNQRRRSWGGYLDKTSQDMSWWHQNHPGTEKDTIKGCREMLWYVDVMSNNDSSFYILQNPSTNYVSHSCLCKNVH